MTTKVETYDRIEGAAAALDAARDARFLGGGTVLMSAVNYGDQSFSRIIRSTDQALNAVEVSTGRIRIGAGVSMARIAAHRDLTFLKSVAEQIGGPAIRNMATIGGNIALGGDLATALLVLDARLQIAGRAGASEITLEEFFRDRDRQARTLIASVSLVRPQNREFRFAKISRVKPHGGSIFSIAAWLPLNGGRISGPRIAFGNMGPVPLRMSNVERALEGHILDAAGVAEAVRLAGTDSATITDAVASAWYRNQVAPVHLKRLLLNQ